MNPTAPHACSVVWPSSWGSAPHLSPHHCSNQVSLTTPNQNATHREQLHVAFMNK